MAEKNINTSSEQFETELQVNLNLDQLSYICEYCGKVNSISAAHCIRCGKRRPRNEYVMAMSKIKNAKSIKAEYIEEQAKIDLDRKEVANQQLVRLVESRVADETASIKAQQAIKLEQDREAIRKVTAREAVLRIIAAENAAEERIEQAEKKAEQTIKGRNEEVEAIVREEREKTIRAAAQKLVVERAGIEEAARERIEASNKKAEKTLREGLEEARDTAEKNAARRAVLQVIAAEKANEDMLRMSKNALQQAALERIDEERKLTEKEYAARFAAEKLAIERAADERIKAEKETLRRVLEDKERYASISSYGYGQPQQAMPMHTVQPISIVPYLNANQPVHQYNPNRVVYKFVPDAVQPTRQIGSTNFDAVNCGEDAYSKKTCKQKVRITATITLLLSVAVLVLGLLLELFNVKELLPILSDKVMPASNSSVLYAFGEYVILGINKIFKSSIAVPAFMANGDFSLMASAIDYKLSILIPIGFTLFVLFDIFVIVQSIVRLISNKAKKSGFILALCLLIFMVVATVGVVLVALQVETNIVDALTATGLIAFLVASIIILVLTIVAALGKKDKIVDTNINR